MSTVDVNEYGLNGDTPQRKASRELANRVRLGRCALKRTIAATSPAQGREVLASILDGTLEDSPLAVFAITNIIGEGSIDELVRTATTYDVLRWPRGIGPERARLLMLHSGVAMGSRFGNLTERQRGVLAGTLRDPDEWPACPYTGLPGNGGKAA